MKQQQRHINKLVKRLVGKGIRYYHKFNEKGYEKAIEKFYKAIELDPNNAELYVHRGDVYFIIEPKKAISDYTKAIELKPNYINAYKYRALTYVSLLYNEQNATISDYKPAISDYTTILKFNPNHFEAYEYRGRIYTDFGQYDLSIKDYTKAIELKPKSFSVYILRGLDYSQIEQYDKAIKDFTMVITSNNKYEKADGYIALGKTYCLIKDYAKAINYYTKAIKIFEGTKNPYLEKCYKKRSEVYLLLGEQEKADTDLKLADELEFKNQKDTATIEF